MRVQNTQNNTKLHGGFTFVETLVAIAILLIAVVAPLSLTYQSLAASRVARNQITASFLAEEALEYARAVRDSNVVGGLSWLSGLSECLVAEGCIIDTTASAISDEVASCDAGGCPPLLYNLETAIYGHDTGTPSPFTRTIHIEERIPDQEAYISVLMSWPDGLVTRSVLLDEYIFNWQ